MSEPSAKRIKSAFPHCKTHRSAAGGPSRQNFPSVVEESLCGVSSLLQEVSDTLRALACVFERSDVCLPEAAAFFHQESVVEQERAEMMQRYLSQRGGTFCSKNIQKPGTEHLCALLPALETMLGKWKEERSVLAELGQLAVDSGDPHTAHVIRSRFLQPLLPKVKIVGDLLTEARRVGCTSDSAGGFGQYLLIQLKEQLRGANVSKCYSKV